MHRCDGRYMDGRTARQHPVRVELDAARLSIVSVEGDARHVIDSWSLASLHRVDDGGSTDALRLKPSETANARLIVEDAEFRTALAAAQPKLGRRSAASLFSRGLLIASGGVLLIATIFFGAPYLSSWLAPIVPVSWERDLGDKVGRAVFAMFGKEARVCGSETGTQALETLSQRLIAVTDSVYDIRVRVTSHDAVNAIALPGGQIVLFHGLIKFAESPEEVAAVIGHEIGHHEHRHATQALIRQLGLNLIVNLLSGNSTASSIGATLTSLAHSRDAEREADASAIRILSDAGIDSTGLARFFKRLDEKHKGLPEMLAFLSTHPSSESRSQRAERQRSVDAGPALSPQDWRALRDICPQSGTQQK